MHSKRNHVLNLFNQKNKEDLEDQKIYKDIHKINSILIYDPKIFKKDTEIQNNSITDEDEYNKEIYNDTILSYNLSFNDENVIVHSKSSFYSFEGKNKNIHMLSNTKNNIQNQNSNMDNNKNFKVYQSSNTIDKDNIEFMRIVNTFNEMHKKNVAKNIEKFGKNDEKKNCNNNINKNEISKFSIKKKKNNELRNHVKSPSQPCNRKNKEGESIYKETKNIIMNKDKKLDMNSITKNLFNKNQQYLTNISTKNNEINKKNTLIKMEKTKKIILEDNIEPYTSKFKMYNNSNIKNYKTKISDCLDRKSKSMIDEDIIFNEKIEKKVEIRKHSPLIPQRIIKKKNLILEEEQVDKNKISSIKRIEIDINKKKRGNLFINSKQDYDNYKNINNYEETKDKENNKKRKFIYSNINSRNKDNNTSEYQKNNDSNYKNTNSIFVYSNNRKHNLNNYNVSSIKPYNKKPIINISINKNERDNKNRSLINNHRKINLNQQKEPEVVTIKIETPILHSRQGSAHNILVEQKNLNSTQSCTNINRINNLKKQSINTENNEPKTKRQNNYKRNLNIKQGKIDLFQNDYNLYLKNRINNNQKNSNNKKYPMSNKSSARNEEKSTYSKNDEISTERSIVTKISLANNKNEGEKIIINTSKSQNNYNLNNLELNSNYTKNSLKRIVNYALKNTTKNFGNNSNNNTKDDNKKIYIYEQNHQNNFGRRKNHNYHVIRSTSQDNNMKLKNKNNRPLQLKIENKITRIVTSTSMDNLRGVKRNKVNGNIKTIT